MKNYKLVLVLKSDIKKDQKDKLFGDVKKWVGEVKNDKVDSMGEKKFAYPIKHEKKGEYVVFSFDAEGIDGELNKRLLIRDEILRHLLVRN